MNTLDVEAILEKCKALRREKKWGEARDLLSLALETHADDRLYYQRGRLFELLDNPNAAVADYGSAIELADETEEYYLCRGNILAEIREYREAIPDFLMAMSIDDESAEVEALVNVALCFLTITGHAEHALSFASMAVQLAP